MRSKRRRVTRRVLIGSGVVPGTCAAGIGGAAFLVIRGPQPQSNGGDLSFSNTLAIPPVIEPITDSDGTKRFDLTLQTGSANHFPEGESETWGVNGPFLGPTLRARRGENVAINLNNELPEMTTIHWHGMHLPANMDGGPHQIVDIGETWSPT